MWSWVSGALSRRARHWGRDGGSASSMAFTALKVRSFIMCFLLVEELAGASTRGDSSSSDFPNRGKDAYDIGGETGYQKMKKVNNLSM